jgi:hypothetical protein
LGTPSLEAQIRLQLKRPDGFKSRRGSSYCVFSSTILDCAISFDASVPNLSAQSDQEEISMKIEIARVCDAVRTYCGLSALDFPDVQFVVGWNALATNMGVQVRAARIAVSDWPAWLAQENDNPRFLMVATPPDELAVLRTSLREVIEYRDHKDIPEYWILSFSEYSILKENGQPVWERFVDLKQRFPDIDGIDNGELGLCLPTRARFFPVCVDCQWLQRRLAFRKRQLSIIKSMPRIRRVNRKFPISPLMEVASYARDDDRDNS